MEVLATFISIIINVGVTSPDNECQQSVNRPSTEHQQSINRASTERQQSVNDVGCCIMCHPTAVVWLLFIIEVLAGYIGNMVDVDVGSPENERQQSVNRASIEL